MRPNQARFVTLSQHTLALGVVLALVVPAANVLSLDVVQPSPSTQLAPAAGGLKTLDLSDTTAEVPAAPLDPQVDEYALEATATEPKGAAKGPEASRSAAPRSAAGGSKHDAGSDHTGDHSDHSDHSGHQHGLPEDIDPADVVEAGASAPVTGYGAVGVTWSGDSPVANDELAVQVRTRSGDEWSEWTDMVFHDDHAPDPGSPDAATSRGGTEAVVVGEVDEVEVRADGAGSLPDDIQLAVVDPGEASATRDEAPEIETTIGQPADVAAPEGAAGAADSDSDAAEAADGAMSLSSSNTAPRPTIYSRAQWGADEKIRNKKSLRYGSVSGGFVHHTVNANNYTQAQVPGIIRSIYAYHVKSRGWSDIGYNFLVDRFGRIWEGRFGGVDKAVVGAHTLGYNDYSFAMSAIGNFETAVPAQSVIDAYSALMAWKLGLHGVSATATRQKIGRGTFPAINGHRDAGSTACPGRHLYSRLGDIRKGAGALQGTGSAPSSYSLPKPDSNLIGSSHPDLVVRRASDSRFFVIPTGGMTRMGAPKNVQAGWAGAERGFVSPDLTGDGRPDAVRVNADGTLQIRAGNNKSGFASSGRDVRVTRNHTLLTPVGDLNGDGRNDLIGRGPKGKAVVFLGQPPGGFKKRQLGRSWGSLTHLTGVGDQTGDGRPDLIARNKRGKVLFIPATGPTSMGAPKAAKGIGAQPDLVGGSDFDGDGRADLLVRGRAGRMFVLPSLGGGSFGPAMGPLGNRPGINQLSVADVNGTGNPDLVARKGNHLVVLANRGTFELGTPVDAGFRMPSALGVVNVGDWDGDGHGDIITVRPNGFLQLRRGQGNGKFAKPNRVGNGFDKVKNLQSVGDINGDGRPDLIGEVNGVTTFFGGRPNGKLGAASKGVPAPSINGVLSRAGKTSTYDPTRYDWKLVISDAGLSKGKAGLATDLVARERGTGHLYHFKGLSKGPGARRFLGTLGAYNLAG